MEVSASQTSYNIDLEQYAKSRTIYMLYDISRILPNMEDVAAAYLEEAIEAARQTVSHHEMPARCILNIGGEYTFGPVTIGLDILNTTLIPQQGCWFMGSIAVRL